MPPPRGTFNPLEGPGDYDVTSIVHSDTYPAISPKSSPATKKSVFIAGASRGVGLALGISYAQSGASYIAIGARSPLTSQGSAIISAAKDAGRPEPVVLIVHLDVTSQSSVEAAAKLVEKEFGRLDIVVNNAGIMNTPAVVGDGVPDEWWETLNVNLKGPYLVTRAFLPLLLKGGDKSIVTISSVGAHLVGQGLSAYQISKMAVMRLMQFVDEDYKDQDVVAFSVHPGNMMTDMVKEFPGGLPEALKPVFVDTVELPADTVTFLTREPRQWLSGRDTYMMYLRVDDEKLDGDVSEAQLYPDSPCSPCSTQHSSWEEKEMQFRPFPSLEYDLVSKKWRILIFWTLVILDSFVIPIVLYFVLNYSTTLDKQQVYIIISLTLFGTLILEFIQRAWRLWRIDSTCRVINTNRYDFDWVHWNLLLILLIVIAEVSVATAWPVPIVRLLALPLPTIFFVFGLELLVIEVFRSFSIRSPFRVSSTPKGGLLRPALYTLIEDVIAVDGNGGTGYRERLSRRYEESEDFRRLMGRLTYFWLVPALMLNVGVGHLIFWRGVNDDTAYVLGWSLPFVWASFWTILTAYWVRQALDEEKRNWEREESRLI
ncbi:hypothetical protein VTL71DRAFT_13699 [Oculimacula yallundae]|uniref:Uncharacterized protein n=1 Tax=Oculimacula yallundae TaxID=86028 RepID=A0ABR4CN28_9HELO